MTIETVGRTSKHGIGYMIGLSLMALFYFGSGIFHFRSPETYLPAMPPYIPWPLAMIYISGAAEILGGIGLLIPNGFVFPRVRAAAAWGIILLLVAISPVHINMVVHPEKFAMIPLWFLWVRLPLQVALMGWAWAYRRD